MGNRRGLRILLLVLALALFLLLGQAIPLYTDWLWYKEVALESVFITILKAKLALGAIMGVAFFITLYINLYLARRSPGRDVLIELEGAFGLPSPHIIEPYLQRFLLLGVLFLSFLSAYQASGKWEIFLRYFQATPFNISDPLFGKDIGFYVFQLPVLSYLYGWAMATLGLAALLTAVAYLLYRGVQLTGRGLQLTLRARAHLLILGALLLFLNAYGYRLDMYELLYSPRGVVYGASYTDVNAVLPALKVLVALSLLLALLCLAHIYRRGWKPLILGLGLLFVVNLVGRMVYPSILQRFRVVPNEIVAETPYIEQNIKYTRLAYGLDKIEEQEFPADENLRFEDLRKNDLTIKNIRLWDHRPLLLTYAQLQEIRTYYRFVDVDIDRYQVNGEYRQVMLSPRELSYKHLPSRIWINEHLTYTHGYGVVVGPVNRVTREGLPEFFVKDIPPVSTSSIVVKRPEIYYGELSNDYVLVKTRAQELDYPAGDKNVYTTYTGKGGVPINSLFRKLLFSARFGTLKIALSNDITAESRIMYYRQIEERVNKAAPFLKYDRDPYMVVSGDGRLFWIVDGYTTSDRYPYSESTKGVGNYIRNSVKAVVDAYNGDLSFYLSDPGDPIIQTYAKAFPSVFKPLELMPADLRAHIRYPEGIFTVQAKLYSTYHMQNPQVFYNKEDLWSLPKKAADGREADTEPYYTIMRLPGEKREEFILLLPFTPARRDNMIAWLAARSDPPNYGKLIAYTFPKAKLVYGPRQIEARIDQDATISQQLTLWSQRGSQVIRGSLLAIPIERSLIYVEPLYLAAEKGSLPELKRVIVAFGNRIAMEEGLELALGQVFGGRIARETAEVARPREVEIPLKRLIESAWEHFGRAQERLRQGNFAAYGEELKKLEEVLKALKEKGGR